MKITLQIYLSLSFLLSVWGIAEAQRVYFRPYDSGSGSYGVRDTFPDSGVADDYGPRKYGNLNWHGGIDFNDPAGDDGHLLLAPFAGTVVDVNRLLGPDAPASKEIALDVGNYRFLFIHVFQNSDTWQMSKNGKASK